MPLVKWSSRLSVGVTEFDGQHQKIVEMINTLHDAMKSGQGASLIGNIVESLINYTSTHFAAEERLMQQHGFPGLDEHKAQHAALVTKVLQMQAKYKEGKALPQGLMLFIKQWLMTHILDEDKQYGPFLNSKGIS